MDLARAGGLHEADDLPARRSAHDRVVDEDDALVLEDAAHRVELHLDAEVADGLLRLDERPADVVIADQAESQRNARCLAVADRRAHARVGDRHHDVGFNRRLGGEDSAEVGAHLVDAAAEHVAVGPGEIDVLEYAVRQLRRRIGPDRPQATVADDQQLAGLDVPNVGGADQIQRAGLGADDPGVAELAERKRTEAVGIAGRNQPVLGQQHHRKRAADLRDRLDQRVFDGRRLRARIQVEDDLGIAGGLEDRTGAHQLVTQLARVDQVAIVGDGNLPVAAVDEEWLRVFDRAVAGRGIARVADRQMTAETVDRLFREGVGDLAHAACQPHALAVAGRDAGAFLSAVLQRVQTERGQGGGLGVAEDPKNAALVFKFVHRVARASRAG